jgi:exosortase
MPTWQAVVMGLLCLWLYSYTIAGLITQWWADPNFSHGFLVPLFSAFVIWQERQHLRRIEVKPSWWGVPIVGFALTVLVVGQLGAELFLARVSMVILGAGLIALFLGFTYLRAVAFPLSFLLLMIPIPAIVFNEITFPLQLLASRVVAAILPLFSVPILREGNIIILPDMALEVAEACSGIRSLMSFVSLVIIYGYLAEKKRRLRYLLVFVAIPISVAANSLRIIGTGLAVQYWDPERARGFFHLFSGWLIFLVSLVMLYLLHRLIRTCWPALGGES